MHSYTMYQYSLKTTSFMCLVYTLLVAPELCKPMTLPLKPPSHHARCYNWSRNVATSNALRSIENLPSFRLTSASSSSRAFVLKTFFTPRTSPSLTKPLARPPKLSYILTMMLLPCRFGSSPRLTSSSSSPRLIVSRIKAFDPLIEMLDRRSRVDDMTLSSHEVASIG